MVVRHSLVSKIERTEIESKSQRANCCCKSGLGWYQRQKELKLKANHNMLDMFKENETVGIKDRKN